MAASIFIKFFEYGNQINREEKKTGYFNTPLLFDIDSSRI
jgi:hypothetical protein